MEEVLGGLLDRKILAVLAVFKNSPQKFFHLTSLSSDAKVPVSTTFRIIKKLKDNKLISETKVGKVSVYSLRTAPKDVSTLLDSKIKCILQSFIESPSTLFHLSSLSKTAKVSLTSTVRIVSKLQKFGLIKKIKIGKLVVFSASEDLIKMKEKI